MVLAKFARCVAQSVDNFTWQVGMKSIGAIVTLQVVNIDFCPARTAVVRVCQEEPVIIKFEIFQLDCVSDLDIELLRSICIYNALALLHRIELVALGQTNLSLSISVHQLQCSGKRMRRIVELAPIHLSPLRKRNSVRVGPIMRFFHLSELLAVFCLLI